MDLGVPQVDRLDAKRLYYAIFVADLSGPQPYCNLA
jgi:hypothetical protein